MKIGEEQQEKEALSNVLIENLPVLRAKLNLTQNDLAKQLGVTRQTIINLEAKKTKATWTVVLALLFVFIASPLTRNLLTALGILDRKRMSLLGMDNLIDIIIDKINNY